MSAMAVVASERSEVRVWRVGISLGGGESEEVAAAAAGLDDAGVGSGRRREAATFEAAVTEEKESVSGQGSACVHTHTRSPPGRLGSVIR